MATGAIVEALRRIEKFYPCLSVNSEQGLLFRTARAQLDKLEKCVILEPFDANYAHTGRFIEVPGKASDAVIQLDTKWYKVAS